LIYGLPQIDTPTGVTADLLYDRYIKINWQSVSGAVEYEIYVVVDDHETELIGVTKLTSFVYEDLEPKTRYKFIVKAVGEGNISKGSEESNTVKTGRKVGPPDEDGELNEETTISKNGDMAQVSIGEDDYDEVRTIDLTKGVLAGSKEVVISMSARVVSASDAENITIIGQDFLVCFNPKAFKTNKMEENRKNEEAGVRFRVTQDGGNTQVEYGKTSLSKQYVLQATQFIGKDSTTMDYLKNPIELSLDYDFNKAQMRKLKIITLNRYDTAVNMWTVRKQLENGDISLQDYIDRLGKYMVIGNRR
jgi:chitodextrinase